MIAQVNVNLSSFYINPLAQIAPVQIGAGYCNNRLMR
jgi:hypothetical protein